MGRGHNIMVTNDGATILKSLYVDNPAAKVLVGMHPTETLNPEACSQGSSGYASNGNPEP